MCNIFKFHESVQKIYFFQINNVSTSKQENMQKSVYMLSCGSNPQVIITSDN
jgi:hypothetical protein